MEQTAVEWLEAHLIEYGFDLSLHKFEIKQAKEMFEKQVRDAWNDGRYENTGCGDSEAYYDETFNK
jgi:hypothetical protein